MRLAQHDGQKASAFAAESDQLVVPAVATAQPQEAVGQDAAFENGVELVLRKLRQVGAGCGLSLIEEGGGVLLHRAVQRGLLEPVALEVHRGAIRPPVPRPRLPAVDLHTLLPGLCARTVGGSEPSNGAVPEGSGQFRGHRATQRAQARTAAQLVDSVDAKCAHDIVNTFSMAIVDRYHCRSCAIQFAGRTRIAQAPERGNQSAACRAPRR